MESRNLYQPYDNSSSSEEENSTDHDTNSDTEPNLDINLHLLNDSDEGLIQAVEETNQQQDIIQPSLPTQVSEANDDPIAFRPSEGQIPAEPQESTLAVRRVKQSRLMMQVKLFQEVNIKVYQVQKIEEILPAEKCKVNRAWTC